MVFLYQIEKQKRSPSDQASSERNIPKELPKMLTETIATSKPRYFRYTLKKQNDRVEYRILSSEQTHYNVVQMANGRAINCYHEDGNKCEARHYHPGVPCSHMEYATKLEQDRREQAQADATFPKEVQEVIKAEQEKCQQVWREYMSAPINAAQGTKKYYSLARKREREANKALNIQRALSQQVINAAIAAERKVQVA
jgi:hypothetical protein